MTNNENTEFEDLPKFLFHYTTVSAFENIYKERKFRATYHEDLNDKSELKRFGLKVSESIKSKIREIVDERMKCDAKFASIVNGDGGLETVTNRETTKHLDILHQETFGKHRYNIFVCSFCAHDAQLYEAEHGLLSQWRGYGIDGGVAIVLNTQTIGKMMEYEQDNFAYSLYPHMGNVIYDNRNDDIKKEFNEVFEHFPKILEELYSNQEPSFKEIYNHYILGSTLVKHHAFHEENEFRIVVSPNTSDSIYYIVDKKKSKIIYYTQKGNREVRYIELFGHTALPIERIIIGPSRIQNFNFQKVSDLVKNNGIEVVKSEIPFLA